MLGGEGCLDLGVRGLLPEAPGGLGPAPWPQTLPEHREGGQRSILHNGEARRQGVAQPPWGGLRSKPFFPLAEAGPLWPLVGVGCSVSHHLGTQEVKPKVGRGGVTALGPGSPAGSWVCEALPVA